MRAKVALRSITTLPSLSWRVRERVSSDLRPTHEMDAETNRQLVS